ncbi:hypothetical protein [Zavarzinella formosa]|uniref:hypothetical protein n=1 Tax=Zavarzinella formosa TaxID=360055 RepID=UPI00036C8D8C|nr:hypothetical protein [Zavarzinella formosa]
MNQRLIRREFLIEILNCRRQLVSFQNSEATTLDIVRYSAAFRRSHQFMSGLANMPVEIFDLGADMKEACARFESWALAKDIHALEVQMKNEIIAFGARILAMKFESLEIIG